MGVVWARAAAGRVWCQLRTRIEGNKPESTGDRRPGAWVGGEGRTLSRLGASSGWTCLPRGGQGGRARPLPRVRVPLLEGEPPVARRCGDTLYGVTVPTGVRRGRVSGHCRPNMGPHRVAQRRREASVCLRLVCLEVYASCGGRRTTGRECRRQGAQRSLGHGGHESWTGRLWSARGRIGRRHTVYTITDRRVRAARASRTR